MDYNKERHKQLVIRSQYFKDQGKDIFLESPEENSELLNNYSASGHWNLEFRKLIISKFSGPGSNFKFSKMLYIY